MNDKNKPPKICDSILHRILIPDNYIERSGDLEEVYLSIVTRRGRVFANSWYFFQAVKLITLVVINTIYRDSIMLKNYIKIAFRNILRNKIYSIINISGLAIGIGCCVLIIGYVLFELSYDRFHEKADNIYRVVAELGKPGAMEPWATTPSAPAEVMPRDFPEVIDAVRLRVMFNRAVVSYNEKTFYEKEVFFADNAVFDIFSFPLVRGEASEALKEPNSLVLTQESARKYFGSENPIGKVLNFDNRASYTVTGVIENIPKNSHLQFDMLISLETLAQQNRMRNNFWFQFNFFTYLLLNDGADYKKLESQFPDLVERYAGDDYKRFGAGAQFYLQPLKDIHLRSGQRANDTNNSDIGYVYIFSIIAGFILVIACINFMNLSTARSAKRAKEVGMRKVIGADKSSLVKQFLGESVIYSFIGLGVALLLVELVTPYFSSLTDIPFAINYAAMPWLIPSFIQLALLVGCAAGIYPAIFLASFQPMKVFRGKLKSGVSGFHFRSFLVVAQFSISLILVVATAIIFNQLQFMKNKRLGFNKEHVLTAGMTLPIGRNIETVKENLLSLNSVTGVAASTVVPGLDLPGVGTLSRDVLLPEGASPDEKIWFDMISVDADFIPTLGIEIARGRNFSREIATDAQESVLINEAAVKALGWDDPIGKTIVGSGAGQNPRKVIGVVADFHLHSLRSAIQPLFISNDARFSRTLSIRIRSDNISETIDLIKSEWKKIDPNAPFEYAFLDESFDRQYHSEEKLSSIFTNFTLFGIFIAFLGLFAMTAYTAEQRTKEIGIRKVVGASTSRIVVMLNREVIFLLLAANIISWPLAYIAASSWLQSFPYRTDIGILTFVLSSALVSAVALLTITFQSFRAATASPSILLKHE